MISASAFVSWSGGKDTSLACYRAMRDMDITVSHLLNMVTEDGLRGRSHGVPVGLIREQAGRIGVPIVQQKTTWQTYEAEFIKAASALKAEGITVGVFGDIDLQEHRDWVERVCSLCGIKPVFPLWQRDRKDILRDFIDSGFESLVVTTRADVLNELWIGRVIDETFIRDITKISGVDACGEGGEYHTFVTAAPFFSRKIRIGAFEKIRKGDHWFMEVKEYA
ncbi:MAG: diphthine--ammonia ligase [Candidatus Omnitrophota bacterium]